MDDLDIDIFWWCGLGHVDDDTRDIFFSNDTALNLFMNCIEIQHSQTGEDDKVNYADEYYLFYTYDLKAAKAEVKLELESIISQG